MAKPRLDEVVGLASPTSSSRLGWDLRTLRERTNPYPSAPRHVGFSCDSRFVVASGMQEVFTDLRTGATKRLPMRGRIAPGRNASEIFLATDAKLEIRDARTTESLEVIDKRPRSWGDAAPSSSADRHPLFLDDAIVDLAKGGAQKLGIVGRVLDSAWSKHGYFAVATVLGIEGDFGNLHLFDANRKQVLDRESGGAEVSVSFSPSGQDLVYSTGGRQLIPGDPKVSRIDVATSKPMARTNAEVYWCRHVADELLLVQRVEHLLGKLPRKSVESIELWDAAKLTRLGVLPLETKRIRSFALSLDRQLLAVAGVTQVRVYRLRRR